jgi:Mg/Co/Ni transporter MgtE
VSKELSASILNGLVWGTVMGIAAVAIYGGFFLFLGLARVFLV